MKKIAILCAWTLLFTACSDEEDNTRPQEQDAQFTVLTLNVDGLPGQILTFPVNPDGPGSEGSRAISQYLARQAYDIVCLQEDFNYHEELLEQLTNYQHDEWSGGITLSGINWSQIESLKFPCDGLLTLWKSTWRLTAQTRAPWEQSYGKFDHAWDDIITKGFRRYELTLPGGAEVVVYNLHADASTSADEASGNDTGDREARQSQWSQLARHIIGHMDARPILVMGDTNSRYAIDPIEELFFQAIASTGRATVGDAWADICHQGVRSDDCIDKILYINPTNGPALIPTAASIDSLGYQKNGRPLGDHYPVLATFSLRK